MTETRWLPAAPAALLAALLLSGCFDGTVRSPSEAGGNRQAGQRHRGHHRQGGKHRPRGDRRDGGDVGSGGRIEAP